MKRLVALLLVLPFLGACGEGPSPEHEVRAAVEEYLDEMRDGDAETFCHKAFPSTVLPARIADRLTLRGLSQLVRGRRTRVTGGLRTTPPARSAAS